MPKWNAWSRYFTIYTSVSEDWSKNFSIYEDLWNLNKKCISSWLNEKTFLPLNLSQIEWIVQNYDWEDIMSRLYNERDIHKWFDEKDTIWEDFWLDLFDDSFDNEDYQLKIVKPFFIWEEWWDYIIKNSTTYLNEEKFWRFQEHLRNIDKWDLNEDIVFLKRVQMNKEWNKETTLCILDLMKWEILFEKKLFSKVAYFWDLSTTYFSILENWKVNIVKSDEFILENKDFNKKRVVKLNLWENLSNEWDLRTYIRNVELHWDKYEFILIKNSWKTINANLTKEDEWIQIDLYKTIKSSLWKEFDPYFDINLMNFEEFIDFNWEERIRMNNIEDKNEQDELRKRFTTSLVFNEEFNVIKVENELDELAKQIYEDKEMLNKFFKSQKLSILSKDYLFATRKLDWSFSLNWENIEFIKVYSLWDRIKTRFYTKKWVNSDHVHELEIKIKDFIEHITKFNQKIIDWNYWIYWAKKLSKNENDFLESINSWNLLASLSDFYWIFLTKTLNEDQVEICFSLKTVDSKFETHITLILVTKWNGLVIKEADTRHTKYLKESHNIT